MLWKTSSMSSWKSNVKSRGYFPSSSVSCILSRSSCCSFGSIFRTAGSTTFPLSKPAFWRSQATPATMLSSGPCLMENEMPPSWNNFIFNYIIFGLWSRGWSRGCCRGLACVRRQELALHRKALWHAALEKQGHLLIMWCSPAQSSLMAHLSKLWEG